MPTYISLVTFTEEGIRNIKETGRRAEEFAKKVKKKGVTIKSTFWTIGRFDIVHVFEAPNCDAAAAVAFALSSMGHVRTETMRAFDLKEVTDIVEDVYELHLDKGALR